MFRKDIFLVIMLIAVLSASTAKAEQISSSWVGGEEGLWGNPDNWEPNIVPDNNGQQTFAVAIDSNNIGVDEIEVGFLEGRTIDQLDCNGIVTLAKWTPYWIQLELNDFNSLTNYGDLTIEFDIVGNVTNTAGARLDFAEHLNIYGNLYNPPGGIIDVFGEDMDIEDANIVNEGLIRACRDGGLGEAIEFHNLGRIELFDGSHHAAIFDNNSTGVIEGSGTISGGELVRNKGVIYAALGSLLVHSDGSFTNTSTIGNRPGANLHIRAVAADINNFGTIEVNSGGAVAFNGNLTNEADGTIKLLDGTLSAAVITQTADANFAGFGTITGSVVIDSDGLIGLTGPTNIIGDVSIAAGAVLEISDGTTLVTGHTTNEGIIHMKGGRIIPQGGLTNSGQIIWETGIYNNIADFNLDGQVNFTDFAGFANTWLWQSGWYQ